MYKPLYSAASIECLSRVKRRRDHTERIEYVLLDEDMVRRARESSNEFAGNGKAVIAVRGGLAKFG
jgi:hypothetical protein